VEVVCSGPQSLDDHCQASSPKIHSLLRYVKKKCETVSAVLPKNETDNDCVYNDENSSSPEQISIMPELSLSNPFVCVCSPKSSSQSVCCDNKAQQVDKSSQELLHREQNVQSVLYALLSDSLSALSSCMEVLQDEDAVRVQHCLCELHQVGFYSGFIVDCIFID
jgi:hypothetical protein